MIRLLLLFACAVCCAAWLASPANAVVYQAQFLAALDGAYGKAYALNDAGQAVGRIRTDTNTYEATLWEPDGSVLLLGSSRQAKDVNNRGQVVGTCTGTLAPRRAFQWNPDGSPTTLPPLPPNSGTEAIAINDVGQVVGISCGSYQKGVMWCYGNVMELPVIPCDINNQGQIVGYNSGNYPVVLNPDGITVHIGVGNHPAALSDTGWVVGMHDSGDTPQPFRWNALGGLVLLPLLPGDVLGQAYGLNNEGYAVGRSSDGMTDHAVLWDLDGTPHQLNPPGESVGCVAYDISESGWVVGNSDKATLWTPVPEPSSLLALLCGVGGLVGLKKLCWKGRSVAGVHRQKSA